MTRDPRRDPQPDTQVDLFPVPGETINLGGALRWVVVAREPAHVVFRVEGMPQEPPRRVSLSQWERVARRSVGPCQGRRVASGMSCARQGSDPLTRAASGPLEGPSHARL